MTAPAASPAPAPQPGLQVASPSGLTFDLSSHGSVRRMAWRELCINLYSGNELEGGPDLLVLRRLSTCGAPEWTPLLGPRSPSRVSTTPLGLVAQGEWGALKYTLHLVLSSTEPAWFWHLDLHNSGSGTCQVPGLDHRAQENDHHEGYTLLQGRRPTDGSQQQPGHDAERDQLAQHPEHRHHRVHRGQPEPVTELPRQHPQRRWWG